MEAFHTNTRNHSWLARGRGAKPWDHTRPTYPELPPQSVRHAPETNTLWKIKHSQKNTNRHESSLTYSKRRLNTHTHRQPHQLQTNVRAELLLLVHRKQLRLHVIARPTHVTLNSNIRSQFTIRQLTSMQHQFQTLLQFSIKYVTQTVCCSRSTWRKFCYMNSCRTEYHL